MKEPEQYFYFGENICRLRESKGWTQKILGNKLGKKTSTISAYETNAKFPSATCLIEMAELFGVSLDTLVFGERADLISVRFLTAEQKELIFEILYTFSSNQHDSEQRLKLAATITHLLAE